MTKPSTILKTMRRAALAMGLAAIAFSQAGAETVTRRQAEEIATQFFNASRGLVLSPPEMVWNGRQLTTARLFPPFYIFNHPTGGFVIVAADNKAFPILGFSFTESFAPDRLTPKQREWLRRYAIQIENIRYDSRIPYDAIAQWTDIRGTIARILSAPYQATDPRISITEAADDLEASLEAGNDISSASALYTTGQWDDMISDELALKGNVVIGLLDSESYSAVPVIVHGRQGDYFRLTVGEPNRALMRLFATEYITDGQYALLGTPPPLPEIPEERPFAFYDDDILPMTLQAVADAPQTVADGMAAFAPVVEAIGDGHFMISFPAPVVLAEVYSVSGAKVRAYKYDSQPAVAVDLTAEAPGFYVALFHTPSGRTFGVKLMR